jgi:hypothetical protein
MGDGAKLSGKCSENKRQFGLSRKLRPARQQRLERTLLALRRAQPAKTLLDHHQLRAIILPVVQPG